MKMSFHRNTVGRSQHSSVESIDLLDTQLDHLSGGIPHSSYPESRLDTMIRPELPVLTARPSDNPDLWF